MVILGLPCVCDRAVIEVGTRVRVRFRVRFRVRVTMASVTIMSFGTPLDPLRVRRACVCVHGRVGLKGQVCACVVWGMVVERAGVRVRGSVCG